MSLRDMGHPKFQIWATRPALNSPEIELPIKLKIVDTADSKCSAHIWNFSVSSLFAWSRYFFGDNRGFCDIIQSVGNQKRVPANLLDFTVIEIRCITLGEYIVQACGVYFLIKEDALRHGIIC